MTKEEILNGMSEEEFYNLYPTEEAYFMAKGGSLSGAPHNGQPTADEFFSYGAPAFGHMNIPMSNPTYLAHGGTYFGGPIRPYAYGGLYEAADGMSTSPYGTDLYTEKKMSPQEWDTLNTQSGYTKIPGKGKYAGYYNPKEYATENWGENNSGLSFTKIGDVGKTVNYSNDPTYKPIREYGYKEPMAPAKPAKVLPALSNRTAVDTNEYFKTLKGADNKLSYYDIKTNQAIDPTKSFQGGKYNPSLLNPPVGATDTQRSAIPAVTMAYGGSMAKYCWGGLPGGPNEMPEMLKGGYNSPTNYGSFSIPMSKGGYYQIGGTPKQLVDWAAREQAILEERLKTSIPPNVKRYYGEYDEPRKFDSIHNYPEDPNIAMGFKGNKVMLISKDDVADNMVKRVNKPRTFVGPTVKGERDVYFDYLHPHEYGGILDANNNQEYPMMGQGGMDAYAFGGNYENLKSFLKTVSKANKKAFGGDNTIQGGNQDYISQRKSTYDSFLKKNVYNSLVDQEEEDISKAFMQMGGFQQPMLNPNNAAYQQGLSNNINQFQKQNAADNKNFLNATTNFVGSVYDTRAKNKEAQKAIMEAAQSSMPKAADGWEYSSEYKKDQKRSELIRAISNKKGIAINDKLSDDELIDMAKKEGIIVDDAKTDKQTTNTDSNMPWYQKLANNFPANSSRGYGLSNKDYNKLYNMSEGTISSGLGMKYGPLARALGKTGRNLFGPKEIYMDIATPYEERMRVQSSPDLALLGPKKSKFRGPYPETDTTNNKIDTEKEWDNMNVFQRMKSKRQVKSMMREDEERRNTPDLEARDAYKNMNLFDRLRSNIQTNRMMKDDERRTGATPYDSKAYDAYKDYYNDMTSGNTYGGMRYGGLPMAADGFSNPVDMTMSAISNLKAKQPDYLPQKSATDMFAKQTDADLKNTVDNAKLVNPETGSSYEKDRITFKRKGIGKALAQYAPAVANQIASGFEARDYRKAQEDLANSQTADRMFLGSTGNRGDYDPNSGMFRPDQMVPVQFPGGMYGAYGGSFQDGGMYEEGEELDLSPEEIEELRAQGYEIEELD